MTDKPMKNGRKYVDSGFVHDMMDTGTSQHYFVRAHVWPSMKMDLPHNVVIVLSVNSGAVIHTSCEPCRASSLGRCSHVVAVLFSILDHVTKHGALISKPCTSKECSWNKGKKRNKDPRRLSGAKYPSKRKESSMPVIDFDPRPVQYRQVTSAQINRFVINLQSLSQNSEPSMWETQLKITYENYDLGDPSTLHQKVNILCENLTTAHLMEIPGTEGQSNSERWFSERWCSNVFHCLENLWNKSPQVCSLREHHSLHLSEKFVHELNVSCKFFSVPGFPLFFCQAKIIGQPGSL